MRIIYILEEWVREVKHAYQRVVRGYDDTALWSLNGYLSAIIIPVLKNLKKNNGGYPSNSSNKEWRKELGIMIKGFEAYDKIINIEWKTIKSLDKLSREQKIGLQSFADNYDDLWD